jgi:hypothetical protein
MPGEPPHRNDHEQNKSAGRSSPSALFEMTACFAASDRRQSVLGTEQI